jgi:hypothetical protein
MIGRRGAVKCERTGEKEEEAAVSKEHTDHQLVCRTAQTGADPQSSVCIVFFPLSQSRLPLNFFK